MRVFRHSLVMCRAWWNTKQRHLALSWGSEAASWRKWSHNRAKRVLIKREGNVCLLLEHVQKSGWLSRNSHSHKNKLSNITWGKTLLSTSIASQHHLFYPLPKYLFFPILGQFFSSYKNISSNKAEIFQLHTPRSKPSSLEKTVIRRPRQSV